MDGERGEKGGGVRGKKRVEEERGGWMRREEREGWRRREEGRVEVYI